MLNVKDITIKAGNVRKEIDQAGIETLALSITKVGLINPISVRKRKLNYEIVAGQRRLLAYKHLQKDEIEAVVFTATDEILFGIQVQENIQREKVSPIEEGEAFGKAIRKLGINQKQLAELIAKSESYVADRMATNKYFPVLLRYLKSGKITFSVAREFAKIGSVTDVERFLEFASNGGCNPRMAREWVRQYKLNNTVVEKVELSDDSTNGDGKKDSFKMMTGCHACEKSVELHLVRHMNLCVECYDIIING